MRERTPLFGAPRRLAQPRFLPTSAAELRALGWDCLDALIISGDAYVDHPSFAAALLGRCLTAHGLRAGIVAQPRWDAPDDILVMGRPRLFVGIAPGNLDSMLAHYTAFRKKRSDDAYTPGGRAGKRPNRAAIVYANLARRAFPGLPVILGGIEASLRRVTHYDFWTDALRRSIVLDAKADLLVYGMGEAALIEAALRLADGGDIRGIRGTAFAADIALLPEFAEKTGGPAQAALLPSHEAHLRNPDCLMTATLQMERHTHQGLLWAAQALEGDIPVSDCADLARWPHAGRAVLIAPPAPPLSGAELDALYALPFARAAHPSHTEAVPAEAMIRASVTTHRGCGGGCSFCSLALHQGRRVASRGKASILAEVAEVAALPAVNGMISDLGGPSANMWNARCAGVSPCARPSCLHPGVCAHFQADQPACVALLREAAGLPGVRGVRVASGVRFDLALRDADALAAYTREFTGGHLKIAPEHICDPVLRLMRKPGRALFGEFLRAFGRLSLEAGKEQYVTPYLMSAFPGCTDEHMRELSAWLKARGWAPRQVQCFIPTPGTVAAAMYYTGKNPAGEPVFVARADAERLRQHALLVGRWGNAAAKGGPARPRRSVLPLLTPGRGPGGNPQ